MSVIQTDDIPLWRWDEIDAGQWAVIQAVKAAFQEGIEDARAAERTRRQAEKAQR